MERDKFDPEIQFKSMQTQDAGTGEIAERQGTEEVQTEEELKSEQAEEGSELTYSQNYYILNRNDILQKRREKEMEAKFGDFSARLVKRPKKGFMWGYGTQMHEDRTTDHGKAQLSSMLVLNSNYLCVCRVL